LTSWLAVSNFLFIMHPSSFYDLQACYVYTPLYGPYSLSEALEGLFFYSLDEFRDSVSIGSKRTLQHELISELSNVVDDLQDYLLYFSSEFLISPLKLPDFIKELRASYSSFEHLTVYWGALINHLVIARKIIEHNFWPHLFQPAIDNLAGLQNFGRPCSFALPQTSWNKSSTSTSTFISAFWTNSTPYTTDPLLELEHPTLNVQSQHLQLAPSETDPTGSKQGCALSLRLDTTPSTHSGSHHTWISLNSQPSVAPHKSHFPLTGKVCPDKVLGLLNCTVTAQRSGSSTLTCMSGMREFVDSKNNVEVKEMDEHITEETEVAAEGDEVNTVLCIHSLPIQLTAILGNGFATVSTRTSSSIMASLPSSTLS